MSLVRSEKWLNWAAYGTWLVVSLPTIAVIAYGELPAWKAVSWVVAFVAFGVGFSLCAGGPDAAHTAMRPGATPRRGFGFVIPVLAMQTVASLAMIFLSGNGTEGATLVIVAAEAAAVLPMWGAWAWVAGQTLLLGVIWALFDDLVDALTASGSFAGFQAFAIAAMSLARSERAMREDLSRAHAELVATQSLLAENSRIAERLRISRDLHDTLGHHLTALSLQLDVASRLTSGQAAEHVREAHAITRLLLGDVRSVVSEMRETSRLNLADAVRALAGGAGALQVHLDLPGTLELDEPDQAHALLRCVQEIITNASRHGGAKNLWIRIARNADGIDLHARDDGRGAAHITWGNGLKGMRERFEEFSGRIEVTPGAGRGFEVHGFMPGPGIAS